MVKFGGLGKKKKGCVKRVCQQLQQGKNVKTKAKQKCTFFCDIVQSCLPIKKDKSTAILTAPHNSSHSADIKVR